MRASHWLAVTLSLLATPADAGVARAEQLLQEASGDPWGEADLQSDYVERCWAQSERIG